MRTADLICIGSQKAATTWLHRMLARHPGVFMPPMKEVHYFDQLYVRTQKNFQARRSRRSARLLHEQFERSALHRLVTFLLTSVIHHSEARRYISELRFTAALPGRAIDDTWYASLFEDARPDQVTCDFTPAYAMLPPAGIAHVRRLNPHARILLILRDPIERALSHARMLVVRHQAPRTAESLRYYIDSWAVQSRDDCIAVLDRWQTDWPAEQFKVLFFDDVRNRPLHVLADVCRFAGLPFDAGYFRGAERAVYRGPAIPVTAETRAILRERLAPILDELARRYPVPAANWGRIGQTRPALRADILPRSRAKEAAAL